VSEHEWMEFECGYDWCRRCGCLRRGTACYPPGHTGVVRGVPECRLRPYMDESEEVSAVNVPTPPNFVVVDPELGPKVAEAEERVDNPMAVFVRDQAAEHVQRRADLIDLLVLKYDKSWHLVERRQDTTTTWAIEPYCLGCGYFRHHECANHVPAKEIEGEDTPGWCSRRRT